MSFYRFNDVITLYTPYDEETWERHIITAAKVQLIDSDTVEDTKVTVYIPIHGRRSLKYVIPSLRNDISRKNFTVKTGQKMVIGRCPEGFPPDNALDVKRVETHLSGSRHVQHIKLVAYNIPPKEEVNDEEFDY